MTVDIEKLKALAEAASQERSTFGAGIPHRQAFRDAANPAAVLELIAELKQAEEDNVIWKGGISALGEALKKLTFCARTVTDGPDNALMAACEAAENALSLGGVSRAIDYIEGLKSENKELKEKYEAARDRRNSITALKAENAGLKTGYAAYEQVNAGLRAEVEALREKVACVDDLSALVRQLVHRLRKAAPDNDLPEKAMDYLKRKGLQGSPLRSEPQGVEPDLDTPEIASLRKDAERWRCVRNAIPMQSPYAVWREGSHVVLGKDADDLVDNFLSAKGASHD